MRCWLGNRGTSPGHTNTSHSRMDNETLLAPTRNRTDWFYKSKNVFYQQLILAFSQTTEKNQLKVCIFAHSRSVLNAVDVELHGDVKAMKKITPKYQSIFWCVHGMYPPLKNKKLCVQVNEHICVLMNCVNHFLSIVIHTADLMVS